MTIFGKLKVINIVEIEFFLLKCITGNMIQNVDYSELIVCNVF